MRFQFCSSLYVASLSYKIFVNAGFLAEFLSIKINESKTVHFEHIIGLYRKMHKLFPIHTETTTTGVIYAVLALTFFFIFYKEYVIASIICLLILLIIALSILLIYFYRDLFRKRWHKIKVELEKQEASKKGHTDADLKTL